MYEPVMIYINFKQTYCVHLSIKRKYFQHTLIILFKSYLNNIISIHKKMTLKINLTLINNNKLSFFIIFSICLHIFIKWFSDMQVCRQKAISYTIVFNNSIRALILFYIFYLNNIIICWYSSWKIMCFTARTFF